MQDSNENSNNNKDDGQQRQSKFKDLYQPNPIRASTRELRSRRVKEDAVLRKQRREDLVTSKRFKRSAGAVAAAAAAAEAATEDTAIDADAEEAELTEEQVLELSKKLQGNKSSRSEALTTLSDYLTTHNGSPALEAYVTSQECKDLLVGILSAADAEEQLLATWVLTNMAAGSTAACEAALVAVPYLIGFLDSQNVALVDQAAWALGNMGAEGPTFRDRLIDNGVLNPLIKLLESSDLNLVQTTCFALSSLGRGSGADQTKLVEAGLLKPLLHHLKVDTQPQVVSEAAWVVVYLTSGPDNTSTQLLEHRLVPLLVALLPSFATMGALAIPLVRSLGNIASGPDENASYLIQEADFLPNLLNYIQSDCRSVKKESLWLLSNLTADHQRTHILKIVESGFIPVLTRMATQGGFDIRKEAGYSLVHIANHGPDFCKLMNHRELLPGFLDFLKSKDHELVSLGLHYVQLYLSTMLAGVDETSNEGSGLFSELNGIDALEAVIVQSDDRDQHRLASALMDTYFGENNGGSRVPTPVGTPRPTEGQEPDLPPQYVKRGSILAL